MDLLRTYPNLSFKWYIELILKILWEFGITWPQFLQLLKLPDVMHFFFLFTWPDVHKIVKSKKKPHEHLAQNTLHWLWQILLSERLQTEHKNWNYDSKVLICQCPNINMFGDSCHIWTVTAVTFGLWQYVFLHWSQQTWLMKSSNFKAQKAVKDGTMKNNNPSFIFFATYKENKKYYLTVKLLPQSYRHIILNNTPQYNGNGLTPSPSQIHIGSKGLKKKQKCKIIKQLGKMLHY